jgi:hypothetical protein
MCWQQEAAQAVLTTQPACRDTGMTAERCHEGTAWQHTLLDACFQLLDGLCKCLLVPGKDVVLLLGLLEFGALQDNKMCSMLAA